MVPQFPGRTRLRVVLAVLVVFPVIRAVQAANREIPVVQTSVRKIWADQVIGAVSVMVRGDRVVPAADRCHLPVPA